LLKINNKCIFDKNSRYLALYSEFQVVVFNLSIDSPNFEKIYDIDKEKYEEIQVIQLVSENENAYRCDVACKLRNHP
jgi:MinD superfamily P-loop ATPase